MIQCKRNKVYIRKIILSLAALSIVGGINNSYVEGMMSIKNHPEIQGKLIYHTYSSYDARDSQLYLFDFETKELSCINDFINGTYHTINACFNSDGTEIVFMGLTNQYGEETWNIFKYTLETKELEQLTYDYRNEDPKFSPDGTKIIYKQGRWSSSLDQMIYSLCELDLETKEVRVVTNDIIEKSMPYYSHDGESIYYMEGVGAESRICNTYLDESFIVNEVYNEPGTYAYYPVIYEDSLYFTRFYSRENANDIIVKMNTKSNEIVVPAFNNADYNCSDACPIGEDLLIVSSTKSEGKGGYDLYMVDEVTGETWPLDRYNEDINNEYEQLGASCYVEHINKS